MGGVPFGLPLNMQRGEVPHPENPPSGAMGISFFDTPFGDGETTGNTPSPAIAARFGAPRYFFGWCVQYQSLYPYDGSGFTCCNPKSPPPPPPQICCMSGGPVRVWCPVLFSIQWGLGKGSSKKSGRDVGRPPGLWKSVFRLFGPWLREERDQWCPITILE